MAEHGLSDDEVADLREAFSMYDVDGGGTLQENMSEGCCLIEPEWCKHDHIHLQLQFPANLVYPYQSQDRDRIMDEMLR